MADNSQVTPSIWNLPNLISFTRILGAGLIVYFGLLDINDVAVFWVFVWGSLTDWLDGYLARRFDQQTAFGAALDPVADRLYILTAIFVLLSRDLVPLIVVILVLGREIFMGIHLWRSARAGFAPPAVHYVGKAGTLLLLYAVPFIFLGASDTVFADLARWVGSAFLGWGVVTYWVAGLMYVKQFRGVLRAS